MNLLPISVGLLLFCFFTTLSSYSTGNDSAVVISISWTPGEASAARSGRKWLGDGHHQVRTLLRISMEPSWGGLSAASTAFSWSEFSYPSQLNPCEKIIRLHFNPTAYRGVTLLSNFSASLTADALGVNNFVREFCLIIIKENQPLETYAYIKDTGMIYVPASLSYFLGGDSGLRMVGQNSLAYGDNSTALEMVHRINIKQDLVSTADGSSDIFAMWLNQHEDNITWRIAVDLGFSDLIRLNPYEMGIKISGLKFIGLSGQVVVSYHCNTIKEMDDSRLENYVLMNACKQEGKLSLLISVQSNQEYMETQGPSKGFKILNKHGGSHSSLAASNPQPSAQDSPWKTFQTVFMNLSNRNAIATIAIAVISLLNIIVHHLRGSWEASSSKEEHKPPSAGAERVCRRFSLAEIKLATGNFSEGLVIGKGGFGKVYKGLIDEWQKIVAIKKLKPNSKQGEREFLTEIETLSEILHNNVVSLIGYCNEHGEMIIVYEYMACGTLADHLYKLPRDNIELSCLTWKQRLNICIGVARGLEYLHTGRGIIHRDLKASNILLDENFVAKVSDFGLAKPERRNKLHSHVSTNVKGTFGYIDPYYRTTSKLIRKSDTYSFGVVLLEVLCGRRALDSEVIADERILTKWAQEKISKGEVDRIIASSIREEISPYSLKTFLGVAGRCLDDEPKNRPTMSEVVLQLEFALKLQESNQNLASNEITNAHDAIHPSISNDGTYLPSTKQTTTYLQPPLDAQTSCKVIVDAELTSGRKQWTKFTTIKPLRFRPWQAFWKRVKPSKKHKWSFADLDDIVCLDSWQYDFSRIRAATCDFSEANKLGQGGSGSVYRGKLLNGQEIAVKRLTTGLVLGNDEFKNELLLLASLEHINLVRFLGFCLDGNERFLIHEFVENSSLDRFIFDPIKGSYFDWHRLYKIIKGIAMGLVYLHQDSRLMIIHRNLKTSNVLLDADLNPKLADFGIARLSEADKTQRDTSRVAGTYGYMAPECAVNGHFSVKTDVFSFGVIVLEILRGQRRNHSQNGETLDLLNLAWKSWNKGTAVNVINPTLRARTGSLDDMLRCFHIGLLCVQENPSSRPTMASIALMLSTSTSNLPIPSKPAFFMPNGRVYEASASRVYGYRQAEASQNGLSITELSPR